MNRYYLDTNILIFAILNKDELCGEVKEIMQDYTSLLYTSSICVFEIFIAYQIDKLERGQKKRIIRNEYDIISRIEQLGVEVVPFNNKHVKTFGQLRLRSTDGKPHTDYHDLAIIAQSITDRIPLISSDHHFPSYRIDGLELIYNKR